MSGERVTTMKHGGRVLRAGDMVKVTGKRGLHRIDSFTVWPEHPDRPVEVSICGGPQKAWGAVTIGEVTAPTTAVDRRTDDGWVTFTRTRLGDGTVVLTQKRDGCTRSIVQRWGR